MYQFVNIDEDPTSLCGVMDADNHIKTAMETRDHFTCATCTVPSTRAQSASKNGARPKKQRMRGLQ